MGLDKIGTDEFTKSRAYKAAANIIEKIGNQLDADFDVVIHTKEYSKEGKQHKYSVNARLNMPGDTLASQRAYSWDLVTAVRIAIESLQKQLESKAKKSGAIA